MDEGTVVVVLLYWHNTSADCCYCGCCTVVLAEYFSRWGLCVWLQYLHNTLTEVATVFVLRDWYFNICGTCGCYTAVLTWYFNICSYCGRCSVDCILLSCMWLLWLLEQQLWLLCMEHMS